MKSLNRITKGILILLSMFSMIISCAPFAENRPFEDLNKDKKSGNGSGADRWADLDYIFDLNALPVVTIEISTNDWNTMNTNFDANERNEEYVKADFIFDKNGQIDTFTNIGLRLRGNTSRTRPQSDEGSLYGESEFDNTHFRVSFNTYVESGRFYRLRNLVLKWHNQDPLYAREILSYDLFNRFGVNASRASYARVNVRFKEDTNVIRFGVYAMIEPVDRSFLLTRYGDNMGNLWKCLYTDWDRKANLVYPITPDDNIGMEYYITSNGMIYNYHPSYDFKTHNEERGVLFDNAKSELESFIYNINNKTGADFENWITANMDVDGFLRAYAINVLVGMWDDYWNNANNYYLYQDIDGKWHFIPFDYDNTFGTGFNWGGGDDFSTKNVLNWGASDSRPLMDKIMSRPNLVAIYKSHLTESLDATKDYFNYTSIKNRVESWHSIISPYVSPSEVDTQPDIQNNSHTIEDSSFHYGYYGSGFMDFKLLSGDETDNYVIRRFNSAREQLGLPYVPSNGENGGETEDSYEPDDTPAEAKEITLGETQNRSLHVSSDIDWIYFESQAGKYYTIRFDSQPEGNILDAFLYKDNFDDFIGYGSESQPIQLNDAESGVYHIRVMSRDNKTGNYTISLSDWPLTYDYVSPEIGATTVIFRYVYNGGEDILLRGELNVWDNDNPYLQLTNVATNMWAIEIEKGNAFENGKVWDEMEYKFYTTDGDWIIDPANPHIAPGEHSNSWVVYP